MAIADEIIGFSQLLGARARATPKSTPMGVAIAIVIVISISIGFAIVILLLLLLLLMVIGSLRRRRGNCRYLWPFGSSHLEVCIYRITTLFIHPPIN